MTGRVRLAVLAAASLIASSCLFAQSASAANLIKNGGFEKPVVPSGSFILFSTGNTFSNWTVVGDPGNVAPVSGDFQQNGFSFVARKGEQFIDLTGTSNTATGVAQTVATSPGQSYTLTFYVGNVHDPGGIFGTTSRVNVLVNGSQVLSAVNKKGAGTSVQAWKKFSVTFTAASASTTISFINGDPGSDTANALDAVSLVAVP